MKLSKAMFPNLSSQALPERDRAERQLALEYLAEAWNSAEEDGVEGQALAHASLFAAIATLVRAFGEEATADLVAQLPEAIQAGDYTLDRTLQ
jgi:hypothetical protein